MIQGFRWSCAKIAGTNVSLPEIRRGLLVCKKGVDSAFLPSKMAMNPKYGRSEGPNQQVTERIVMIPSQTVCGWAQRGFRRQAPQTH